MKHAYILAVYKNSEQVIRLYERLNDENAVFVIHICLNASNDFTKKIKNYFNSKTSVFFCKRERATVFRFGIVDGVMNAIETLIENNVTYDYISSLSGQDYPIKPNRVISDFLSANKGKEFITFHPLIFENEEDYKKTLWIRKETFRYEYYWIRFSKKGPLYSFPVNRFTDKSLWKVIKIYLYELPEKIRQKKIAKETIELIFSRIYSKKKTFIKGFEPFGGWAWWTLTYDCSKYMLETYRNNPQLKKFFKFSWTPDEMIYQTILLNSPFKVNIVNNDLRAIFYPGQVHSHPRTFTVEDFEYLKISEKLFARKFDATFDNNIIDMIDEKLLK